MIGSHFFTLCTGLAAACATYTLYTIMHRLIRKRRSNEEARRWERAANDPDIVEMYRQMGEEEYCTSSKIDATGNKSQEHATKENTHE